MAVTLQNLRDISYAIIREEEDASAYPLVLLDSFLNRAQKKIFRGNVINPMDKEDVAKGQLGFSNTEVIYSNVRVTYATEDIESGDTTIMATTDDYPTAGALYIEGTIITYTGKTSTTFTGCSGVIADFASGTQISICYALPADFSSTINLTFNNVYKVPCILFDDIFETLNSYKGMDTLYTNSVANQSTNPLTPAFYTIKDDSYLIVFNLNGTSQRLRLRYQKNPTRMVESTDEASIPDDDYAEGTIPYLAVAEMFFNRGEEQRASEIINYTMGNLREMYKHYNNSSFESISGTRYGTTKSTLNI